MSVDLLHTPLGLPGSGRVRYGAAMALHAGGQISDGALEVYRIAAANDYTDPAQLLTERGETGARPSATLPAGLISRLVAEADQYLSRHSGPGIADVRAGIARWCGGPVTAANTANPVVTACLGPALGQLQATHPALTASIAAAAPHLNWVTYDLYPPDQIGPDFASGHAFCVLIGDAGAIPATDFDFGLFLIAPHVLYRDHCHAAPELYAPLTGPHGWRFRPGAPLVLKPAHQPVWNDPFRPHLTKVGPVPFLSLFCWTKDTQAAAQVLSASDWPGLQALRLPATLPQTGMP